MASLSEHADNIRAAIMAAEADGFKVESEIYYARFEPDSLESVDLEIRQYSVNGEGHRYIANWAHIREEWR